MELKEFERIVEVALAGLPPFFQQKLDNVDVVVVDWPTPEEAKGKLLLGLYQGVPLTARSRGYSLTPPDKISIFRGPITLVSRGNQEMMQQVIKDTVEHEVAHHFGISDERLKQIKRAN